jgi:predicted Ser/Thr protein kinase
MMSPGSTEKPGYLYHQPAFPVEGMKLHRHDNKHRLQMLLRGFDWPHKNVLDLGCNVGYFSIMLALQGARVTGVDKDERAIALATDQATSNGLGSVSFQVPTDRSWMKDKDVLIALSVLPWIYETEKDPESYITELFKIPMAFIEIQYPPDGRASVPGVVDDRTCREWLEKHYLFVYRIGETVDDTDGVKRVRTMWQCVKGSYEAPKQIYGSQSIIEFQGDHVIKTGRPGKEWDARREAEALRVLRSCPHFPELVQSFPDRLIMRLINGELLTASSIDPEDLSEQLNTILKMLERYSICHNDIRPENIIVGVNGRVYLIDFGWATKAGEDRPTHVNPLYPGTDRDAVEKILKHHLAWTTCG